MQSRLQIMEIQSRLQINGDAEHPTDHGDIQQTAEMQSRLQIMENTADIKDAVDTEDTADVVDTADMEDTADTVDTADIEDTVEA